MIYVLGAIVVGLAWAALASEGAVRVFVICCLLLNLAAIVEMAEFNFPYAYSLMPSY